MASGVITKVDSLQLSAAAPLVTSKAAIEVRTGIVAVIFEDADVLKCATYSCDSSGTLTKLDEETITGAGVALRVTSAVKIADGIAAFTYWNGSSPNFDGHVGTVAIASNGTITAAIIDVINYTGTAGKARITHAIGDFYAVGWSRNGTFLVTIEIDSSGNIAAALADSVVVNSSTSSDNSTHLQLSSGYVAVWYLDGLLAPDRMWVNTYSINVSTGALTAVDDAQWGTGVAGHRELWAFQISGTIRGVSYEEAFTSDGWVDTFDISDVGVVTTSLVDTFEYEPVQVRRWNSALSSGGIICLLFEDDDFFIQFKTVDVDSSGNIGDSIIDTETLNAVGFNTTDYPYLLLMENGVYVANYTDDGSALQVDSLTIGAGSIFPSQAITRVTNLIHRYVREGGVYTLEMSLGEVT